MEDQNGSGNREINPDWPKALTILRIVRGLSQEDLAKACGIRSATISDYERGKMIPGLRSVERLLVAEDYSMAALDDAIAFIQRVKTKRLGVSDAPARPAGLRGEIEETAAATGAVVAQLVRLMLRKMNPNPTPMAQAQPSSPANAGNGAGNGMAEVNSPPPGGSPLGGEEGFDLVSGP